VVEPFYKSHDFKNNPHGKSGIVHFQKKFEVDRRARLILLLMVGVCFFENLIFVGGVRGDWA